jgi:hypothetical protein
VAAASGAVLHADKRRELKSNSNKGFTNFTDLDSTIGL